MRTVRGVHLQSVKRLLRLFVLFALATIAAIGVHHVMAPTVSALDLFVPPAQSPTTQADGLDESADEAALLPSLDSYNNVPRQDTPVQSGSVKPTETALHWTDTRTAGQTVDYDVSISRSNATDGTGTLTGEANLYEALTEPTMTLTDTSEGEYYWQVRSCDTTSTCSSWSPVWKFIVDGTAPAGPSGSTVSDPYDVNVRFQGEAEAGTTVRVAVGTRNCMTVNTADSTWTCSFSGSFEYGDYSAVITATDAAGNASQPYEQQFSVSELFVAPVILEEELATELVVVPADETPTNEVMMRPVSQHIDVISSVNRAALDSKAKESVLTTDGGIIQASQEGWQVMGLSWYWWVGGITGLAGSWWTIGASGQRRLGSLLSV